MPKGPPELEDVSVLDVQALRFARMFRRQVDLHLTQQQCEDFIRDLHESLDRSRRRGEPTSPFEEAEVEYLKGRLEGRIIVPSP